VWAILLHQGLPPRHQALKEPQTKGEMFHLFEISQNQRKNTWLGFLFFFILITDFFPQKHGRIIKKVPLPTLTYHLTEMIKKVRTVSASSPERQSSKSLYRGMSNVCMADGFLTEGGAELVCIHIHTYTFSLALPLSLPLSLSLSLSHHTHKHK
jgi:hypothetical protein